MQVSRFPGQETRLNNIDLSNIGDKAFQSEVPTLATNTSRSFFGDHDLQALAAAEVVAREKPEKGVTIDPVNNLQSMIEEGWKQDLQVNTLPAQLQQCMPELHPTEGPHAIFEQPLERERAESSCICALVLDRTSKLVSVSPTQQDLGPVSLSGRDRFVVVLSSCCNFDCSKGQSM